jgi:hypothetical protein
MSSHISLVYFVLALLVFVRLAEQAVSSTNAKQESLECCGEVGGDEEQSTSAAQRLFRLAEQAVSSTNATQEA